MTEAPERPIVHEEVATRVARGKAKRREVPRSALAVWERLAPDRIRCGVLTPWDVDAFAMFCEAIPVAHQAATYAAEHIGDKIVPGAQSPVSRLREAVAVCATLGGRFGWTPSDRAKLVVGGEKRDDKERLLS